MTGREAEERREMRADTELDFPVDATYEAEQVGHADRGDRWSPVDAYLKSQVWIEVGICFRVAEVEPRYWLALFQRCCVQNPDLRTWIACPIHVAGVQNGHHFDEKAVLVDIDEFVQDEQSVVGGVGESELPRDGVWLYGFDGVEDVLPGDGWSKASRRMLALGADVRLQNRELRRLAWRPAVKHYELPSQVIQGRSHVREKVTE